MNFYLVALIKLKYSGELKYYEEVLSGEVMMKKWLLWW